jgi:hypothetical protein
MKKFLFNISVFVFAASVLTSCEEDKVVLGNNAQALAGFNTSSGNLTAADPTQFDDPNFIEIEVGITTKSNVDRAIDIDVNTALSSAVPAMYTIDESSLVIPAGEYTAKVKIFANFDALPETQRKSLILDLVSIDGMDLLDEQRDRFVVTLYRVCPRELPRNYVAFVTGSVGSATPQFNAELVPLSGIARYSVTNLWGNFVAGATGQAQYNGQFPYPGTLTINCDNSIDIVGSAEDFPGGTGVFDPNTNEFEILLNQTLFTTAFQAQIYYMPAP